MLFKMKELLSATESCWLYFISDIIQRRKLHENLLCTNKIYFVITYAIKHIQLYKTVCKNLTQTLKENKVKHNYYMTQPSHLLGI